MSDDEGGWLEARSGGLRVLHRPSVEPRLVLRAIERHRENAARRHAACEHWAPGSSVSRVVLEAPGGPLDLAVKWTHWRGLGRALGEALHGSRAARALRGARLLGAAGVPHPEPLAIAEERRGPLLRGSFLLARFAAGSAPLSAALPGLQKARARRRRLAALLGDCVGTLHARDLDHTDLKHSNLLVTAEGGLVLLDLDALVTRRLSWPQRVRALGQLEAYARDLAAWLPRSDRARFLDAYLTCCPQLAARRRELVRDVEAWAGSRLAEWATRDRSGSLRYPLVPRAEASESEPTPGRRI